MSLFNTYWQTTNTGDLKLMRRRPFSLFYHQYERFSWRENKLKAEINELYEKLVSKCKDLDAAYNERDAILNQIAQSGDRNKGQGAIFSSKMGYFSSKKKPVLEPESTQWEGCMRWIMGPGQAGGSIADNISGVKVKGASRMPVPAFLEVAEANQTVGSYSHSTKPQSRNQQKRNRGNNNNNQQ